MSDSFEEQKEKFNDILKEVKALRKENEYLKQRLQLMEAKFDDMEVQKRANNIIVAGVPKQTDINTDNIVCKILSAINIQKGKTDVLESFRLNKKKWTNPRKIWKYPNKKGGIKEYQTGKGNNSS